jgi:hypothetical protein
MRLPFKAICPASPWLTESVGCLWSIANAAQRARQTLKHDLNMMSLVPYKVSRCSVMPAFMAKAWNHSCTSSVSKVPILSRPNWTLKTRNGRPDTSIATRVSASSIGRWTSA